jgi:lactoylglutathione lyase
MDLVTIVYVTDMDLSLEWYRRVLPDAELISTSRYWSELSLGNASLALHSTNALEAGTQLGLALTANRPLEDIRTALVSQGIAAVGSIDDQPFGRSMLICDPDGLAIQINEHDPQRYPAESS